MPRECCDVHFTQQQQLPVESSTGMSQSERNQQVIARQAANLAELSQKVNGQRLQMEQLDREIVSLMESVAQLERKGDVPVRGTGTTLRGSELSDAVALLEKQEKEAQATVATLEAERNKWKAELDEVQSAYRAFLENVKQAMDCVEYKIQQSIALEQRFPNGFGDPAAAIHAVRMVEDDRENEIRRLHADWERLADRMRAKDEELSYLLHKVQREVPLMRAKKDDEILKIRGTWMTERAEMLREYDRLLALNREQRFHLHRGTNKNKDDDELTWAFEECRDLKARETKLIREIEKVRVLQKDAMRKHHTICDIQAAEGQLFLEMKERKSNELATLKQQKQLLIESGQAPRQIEAAPGSPDGNGEGQA